MANRPNTFRLNPYSPLHHGLVFAGLRPTNALFRDDSPQANHADSTQNITDAQNSIGPYGQSTVLFDPRNSSKYFEMRAAVFQRLVQQQFSVSVWATFTGITNDSSEFTIISQWPSGQRNVLLRYDANANDVEFFTYTSSQVGGGCDISTAFEDREYHHICARYDGAEMAMYFDGVKNATTFAQTGNLGEGSTPSQCRIGVYSGDSYQGALSDLLIYDRALAEEEILQLADPSNAMISGLIVPSVPIVSPPPAAPPVGNAMPMAMNHYRQMRA